MAIMSDTTETTHMTQAHRWPIDPAMSGFILITITSVSTFILNTSISSITIAGVGTLIAASLLFVSWVYFIGR